MSAVLQKVRALGLCSGGLDSILAALVLRRQGIDVTWISFETPFFSAEKARAAARHAGISLIVEDITTEYMQMLKNPSAGYGRHMNPCMDCHALMFKIAGRRMQKEGCDFLFSGEVVGQRPMSQTKPSIRYVEKHSGFSGYILRPLSAKLLPESVPEKEGRVDREGLLDISGRSRKVQIRLAREFGVDDYPNPAGGCLLTYAGFAKRLKDLFAHQATHAINELHLLKYGRHFRFPDDLKVIVGRTLADNEQLVRYHSSQTDSLLSVRDYPGPVVLVPHHRGRDAILRAASMAAGYSKAPRGVAVAVEAIFPEEREMLRVVAAPPAEFQEYLLT